MKRVKIPTEKKRTKPIETKCASANTIIANTREMFKAVNIQGKANKKYSERPFDTY